MESKGTRPEGVTERLAPIVEPGGSGEYCLYVAAGPRQDLGRTLALGSARVVVGSDPGCDLVLQDSSVSRRHLTLAAAAEGVLVQDLGSTNGTTYLGQRIEMALVRPGTRLFLGRCALDILPADARGPAVPARDSYGGLLGSSLPMRKLYGLLQMLDSSDVPVLIEGETGTGKELVARALHAHGARASKPFVVIDCANISGELIESELFGHRKGAFTGAITDRIGAFEAADGGTVFIDELGDLPAELQPKLLRVLETGEVRRLGDALHRQVDFRLLSASQHELAEEVAKGRFRADLYYRVSVVRIRLPPLRERKEDIPALAEHLAGAKLPEAVHQFLLRQEWPGNVRELRNAVQRILALGAPAGGAELAPGVGESNGIPAAEAGPEMTGYREAREKVVSDFERAYLSDLWTRHQKNLSAAARAANIDRKQLRDLLKKYGLHS